MNKYYITCGDEQFVIMSPDPLTACMRVFRKIFSQKIKPTIPLFMHYSEQGFESGHAIPMSDILLKVMAENESSNSG